MVGRRCYKSLSNSEGQKIRGADIQEQEDRCHSSNSKTESSLPLDFVSVLVLIQLDDAYPYWLREIFFTQTTDLDANPSRNTLTDTPKNNVLPVVRAPFSPVKLTY
jgi:hypothetical protein